MVMNGRMFEEPDVKDEYCEWNLLAISSQPDSILV